MNELIATNFPKLNAAVAASKVPFRQKSLYRVLEIINTYAEAETIPNPEFNTAKDALNTVVDLVDDYDGIYGETFRYASRFPQPDYKFDLGYMYANQVAGKIKLANKKGFKNEIWLAIAIEIVTIYDALMAMKSKIVKRRGRSEEEKADDYVPPMPTTAAAIKVLGILESMTDDLTKQFATILFNDYVSSVQFRIDNPRKREDRYMPTHADFLLQTVGEDWDSFNGNYTSLKADFRNTLQAMADKEANYAQRMFLYKNVTKLAVILDAKPAITHYKIRDGRVNGAGFQGEIRFTFADNSMFTVRNKVIVNVSVHGKAFNQFPTTFHDVVLADGVMLPGQPSQEEMIEVFAKV